MKVCQNCGVEIGGRDGDNYCETCEGANLAEMKKARKRTARKEREAIMRSLGLTKVRGALGGTYWE